jgi:hypothetical protein
MFSVYIEPEVIKGFLTLEECNTLINYNSEFRSSPETWEGPLDWASSLHPDVDPPSFVWDILQNKHINKNSHEISSILKKCSEKFHIHQEYFTDLTVVKYTKGGFISSHIDSELSHIRSHTILLYLNENYEGGETEFPNLNKQFKLNTGDILYFHNLDSYGNPTALALHQGNVVKSGEKLICNLWVHEH